MSASAGKGINSRVRGAILASVATGVLVAAVAAFLVWYFYCPCGRMPGGYLFGDFVEEPVDDWTFANNVPLCQIQVDAGILSHALNLNCMATPQGELYLSCSQCGGKRWSSAALEDSEGRIRLGDELYPVTFTRIRDPRILDRSWAARARKLQGPGVEIPPRPDHWWTFRVESRTGS